MISRLDVAPTCESARVASPTRRQICGGSISRLLAVWKGRNNQFPFQVVPAPPSSALIRRQNVHCGQPRPRVKRFPAIRDLDPQTAQLGPIHHELQFPRRKAQQGASSPVDQFAILPGSFACGHLLCRTRREQRARFSSTPPELSSTCTVRREDKHFLNRSSYLPNRN